MVAIVFYKTRGVFNNFDNKNYIVFMYRLNLVYKFLSIQLFLEQLLDKMYNNV